MPRAKANRLLAAAAGALIVLSGGGLAAAATNPVHGWGPLQPLSRVLHSGWSDDGLSAQRQIILRELAEASRQSRAGQKVAAVATYGSASARARQLPSGPDSTVRAQLDAVARELGLTDDGSVSATGLGVAAATPLPIITVPVTDGGSATSIPGVPTGATGDPGQPSVDGSGESGDSGLPTADGTTDPGSGSLTPTPPPLLGPPADPGTGDGTTPPVLFPPVTPAGHDAAGHHPAGHHPAGHHPADHAADVRPGHHGKHRTHRKPGGRTDGRHAAGLDSHRPERPRDRDGDGDADRHRPDPGAAPPPRSPPGPHRSPPGAGADPAGQRHDLARPVAAPAAAGHRCLDPAGERLRVVYRLWFDRLRPHQLWFDQLCFRRLRPDQHDRRHRRPGS